MLQHDGHVGNLLKKIDDLGIADNTIVIYRTDNGPHRTPGRTAERRRSAARRTPTGKAPSACRRWSAGRVTSGQDRSPMKFAALDWLPTFLAAAGDPDIKQKLLDGYAAMGKTFKVHLDGYNQLPYLTGQEEKGRVRSSSTSTTTPTSWQCATRTGRSSSWSSERTAHCRSGPSRSRTAGAKMFDLRRDPYERADITSNTYYDWAMPRAYILVPAQAMSASSSRRSSSSLRARSLRASRSAGKWRSWRRRCRASTATSTENRSLASCVPTRLA